jgi:hypothetical protein
MFALLIVDIVHVHEEEFHWIFVRFVKQLFADRLEIDV